MNKIVFSGATVAMIAGLFAIGKGLSKRAEKKETEDTVITNLINSSESAKVFIERYSNYLYGKEGTPIVIHSYALVYLKNADVYSFDEIRESSESIMKLSFYELEINEKYGNVFRDVLGGVLNELSLMISKVTDNYHYYTFPIEASSREIILPVLIQKMDNAIDSQSYKEFEKIFKLYCDQMLILEPDMLMQKIEKTNRILACESIEDLDIRDKKLYILLNSHMNEYQELVAQSMRYGH